MDVTPQPHPLSYWLATAGAEPEGLTQLAADRTAEVAVIGGGYTGLSAAYRLAATHGIEAVVLEAHRVGWGASGRNGGFAMISMGKLSLQERIQKWGLEAARRSVRIGVEALEAVRDLIAKEGIACDPQADGWINVAHHPRMVAVLRERLALYRDTLGYGALEFLDRDALAERGYLRGPAAHGALHYLKTFGLHPLKYVWGMARAALRRGAAVHQASPVVAWETDGRWNRLSTPGGTVRARRVVVATNGYTPERLHPFFAGRTLPATSNIIVTRPITEAEWTEVGMRTTQVYSDTRYLLHYWRRLPDGRMLFGARGGILDTPASLRRRRAQLEADLGAMFPALAGVGSEYFWWGNVCLPYDRHPHVHTAEDDPTVGYAMGYTGTGVAMATWAGALAGDLAAGKPIARDTPITAAGLPRFPLPFLRRVYLASAYLYYGAKDR
jgi:glycine/D-amino acid oxidase-like deaminating enzyme